MGNKNLSSDNGFWTESLKDVVLVIDKSFMTMQVTFVVFDWLGTLFNGFSLLFGECTQKIVNM